MVIMQGINLGLRFLLELCVLAALGYWGFKTGKGPLVKIGLGMGAPLLAAVVWGTFGAPNAAQALQGPLLLVLEVIVFGSGVAALYATGQPRLAWPFGLLLVLNRVLMYIWAQ